MSIDDQNSPKPVSPWVNRLANPEHALPSPVDRLARHLLPTGGQMWRMQCLDGEEPGSLHFSVPKEWLAVARKNHDYRIPTSLHHTHGDAEPFSRAVEDGKALCLWLDERAIPGHLPRAQARALLRQRAEALCEVLQESFDILPLEVRLYFPSEKIAAGIRDLGHPVGVAMFLATDAAHQELLSQKIYQHLLKRRDVEQVKAAHEASLPKKRPSAQAVEAMLAEHGDTFFDDHEGEKRLVNVQYTSTCMADIAQNMRGSPVLVEREGEQFYTLPYTDDAGKKHFMYCDAKGLGLDEKPSHVLLVRLSDDFPVTPDPSSVTLPPTQRNALHAHDMGVLWGLGMGMHAQFGHSWGGTYLFRSAMGNAMLLMTHAPHPEQTLKAAAEFLEGVRENRQSELAEWQDYLKSRLIDTPRARD